MGRGYILPTQNKMKTQIEKFAEELKDEISKITFYNSEVYHKLINKKMDKLLKKYQSPQSLGQEDLKPQDGGDHPEDISKGCGRRFLERDCGEHGWLCKECKAKQEGYNLGRKDLDFLNELLDEKEEEIAKLKAGEKE